jgi:hypothetical protein
MTTKFTLWAAAMVAASWLVLASAAQATPLSFVNVNAPKFICVFDPNPNCTWADTGPGSVATFLPPPDLGKGILQSNTPIHGVAPAPGAGDWGYVYRVDLTNVRGANCVTRLALKFGPPVPLPYPPIPPPNPPLADVFVVVQGGLGSVGLASVSQGNGASSNVILFTFAGKGVCPGASSFFFGLATKGPPLRGPVPAAGVAQLYFSPGGGGPVAPVGLIQVP